MANPSEETKELIRARVSDWEQSTQDIRDALNNEMVPNPIPQPTMLPVISSAEVLGRLSQESLAKLDKSSTMQLIKRDIENNDRPRCLEWPSYHAGAGNITPAEATSIVMYLLTPVPDPSWQPQVPAPMVWLYRMVDDDDVEKSRPENNGA